MQPSPLALEALRLRWEKEGCPKMSTFAQSTGLTESTVRRWLKGATATPPVPIAEPKTFKRKVKDSKTYVITSAQNATPVLKPQLATLLQYCKKHKAELIIIPFRYQNPTSMWSKAAADTDWWAEELLPYLCDARHFLGPNLVLLADIKIQPTASDVLSGMQSISGGESCIIGHPKIAFTAVAAPSHHTPKILTTTGCVTVPNYTNTKAGKKGEFHHSQAAVVVELSGKKFHVRHLASVKDGSFIDLDTEYTSTGTRPAPPALAMVQGDTHVEFADQKVLRATFDASNSLAKMVRPKVIIWHDVLDFFSGNHHHRGDPFIGLAKHRSGLNNVEAEVRKTFALVDKYMQMFPGSTHVFPHSNHDAALMRWIKETDWRSDPANAKFYLETAMYLADNTTMGNGGAETPDPFAYWGKRLLSAPKRAKFLAPDEACVYKGVDLGNHGHLGPNGSRGSLKGMARMGVKVMMGHSHTPGIYEGAMQVGTTSLLRMGYNKGPSSWLQTHGVLYANGKRTLINFVDGEYTTRRLTLPP